MPNDSEKSALAGRRCCLCEWRVEGGGVTDGKSPPNSLVTQNAKLEKKGLFWLIAFASVAWLVPDERNAASAVWDLFDYVARHVPAIEKVSNISAVKHATYGYLAVVLILLPLSIVSFLTGDAILDRYRHAFSQHGRRWMTTAFFIYVVWIPLFFLICAICLVLPFDLSNEPGPTGGQALFSLMIGSRLGLSLVGSLFFTGVAALGWVTSIFLVGLLLLLISGGENHV